MKPEEIAIPTRDGRVSALLLRGEVTEKEGISSPSGDLSAEQCLNIFRSAMRRLGGAVNLITTQNGAERHGLTATAVCSLTANPPRLLACINLNGRSYKAISEGRCMAVNVLAAKHKEIATSFAGKSSSDPFSAVGVWTEAATGAPILTDALVSFDCEVEQIMVTTTHAIVIGEIRHISYGVVTDESDPLFYIDGKFVTSVELPTK